MLRSVFILVRPGIPNLIKWQFPAILGVVDLALRPYLPNLMLPRCPDRPYLSRLLYCRFPPSRLLCNKPAVDPCCVVMNAHPHRIGKQADVRAISLLLHHTPQLIVGSLGRFVGLRAVHDDSAAWATDQRASQEQERGRATPQSI